MLQRTVRISNELGLHARAAARLVRLASKFQSEIRLRADSARPAADGKSILSLVLLAAPQGTRVTVSADGRDEQEALQELVRLIENRFGESK